MIKKIVYKSYKKIKKLSFNTNKTILKSDNTNALIKSMILEGKPFMISRLGVIEMETILTFINSGKYSKKQKFEMVNNTGFYPTTDEMMNNFSIRYLNDFKNIDLLGVSYNKHEDNLIDLYINQTHLTELKNLEPYYYEDPWSKYLENKKILIIHPFDKLIDNQYKNKDKLFENKSILPNFELITLKSPQTLGGGEDNLSWFKHLEQIQNEIKYLDFDIAIVGAGSYGLPLASYIKEIGKSAIHLGGSTQILFGIKGKRWDNHDVISTFYNDYWVRPGANERPQNYKKIEGGCYW